MGYMDNWKRRNESGGTEKKLDTEEISQKKLERSENKCTWCRKIKTLLSMTEKKILNFIYHMQYWEFNNSITWTVIEGQIKDYLAR